MLTNRIEINALPVRDVLQILLEDKTTGENIIWATGSYAALGEAYVDEAPMTVDALAGMDAVIPLKSWAEKDRSDLLTQTDRR